MSLIAALACYLWMVPTESPTLLETPIEWEVCDSGTCTRYLDPPRDSRAEGRSTVTYCADHLGELTARYRWALGFPGEWSAPSVGLLVADLDGSGLVGAADFAIWRRDGPFSALRFTAFQRAYGRATDVGLEQPPE